MSRASTLSGFTTAIGAPTNLNVGVVTAIRITAQNITSTDSYDFTNVNITGIATIGESISIGSTLVGVTTINSSGIHSPLGVSTLSNVVIGGATTEMVVTGDLRVTGIITTGTGTITIDGTNNRIGIGTQNPETGLDLSQTTDAVALPQGTTAQRPTGNNPYIRYNTTNSALEFYNGTDWVEIISDYFPSGSTILG